MADQTTTIPKGWKMTTLGEVAVLNYGKALVAENRSRGEIPVYGSSGITGWHDEPLVKEKGLIIGRKGTVGVIYKSEISFYPIDTVYYITQKDTQCDLNFLYNLLLSLGLDKMNSDSAVPGLNRENAYAKSIFFPPLPEQRAIAAVLSSLDDKIELLREQNKTLEATAQAIFKEWFVKFNFPNSEGKPYKASGGKMIDSELGDIPDGWRAGKIKDLIDILSGFAFSSSDFSQDGKYKLVTIKNVQDRYFDSETKDKLTELPERMPDYCKLDSGDILLSLTGNVGRICLVNGEHYLLNQRVAKLRPKNPIDYAFSYLLFLQNSIFSLLQTTASGTTQQNLSPIQTKEIEIVIAERKTLDQFGAVANKLIQKINNNNSQIQTLSTLRDALLPKLMKGEIRVKGFGE